MFLRICSGVIFVLVVSFSNSVQSSDVMRFHFDPPKTFVYDTPYIYEHENQRMDHKKSITKDVIESDFGAFFSKISSNERFQESSNNEDILKNRTLHRPRFLTQVYSSKYEDSLESPLPSDSADQLSYIQKIPKLQIKTTDNKQGINVMLKSYLGKLYSKKYSGETSRKKKLYEPYQGLSTASDEQIFNDPSQESKFIDGSLWNWKNKTMKFANKLLSIFTVVQFQNSQCQASNAASNYIGTCYHQSECMNMNGTTLGNCADGYGVCCVFKYTCGGSSRQNCTYFESPGYPNYDPPGSPVNPPIVVTPNPSPTPDPRFYVQNYRFFSGFINSGNRAVYGRQASTNSSLACFYNVFKVNNNVQQMRIDFIDLELDGPFNGTCSDERLVISGQNINDQIPIICGYNSGQHVYVDVSMLSGPLQISVLSNSGARKRFRLRICQFANMCSSSNNCLQYYTGITGMIQSFNYDQSAMFNRSAPGYFNNLNYAICIRKEAGYCSITYSNTPAGVEYPFQMRNIDDAGQNTVPPGQAGAEIFNCPDDYIVIGGIRLCGNKFNDGAMIEDFTRNAPVTDTSAGPIVIPVRTDRTVTGRGFKLFYTQNPCMPM